MRSPEGSLGNANSKVPCAGVEWERGEARDVSLGQIMGMTCLVLAPESDGSHGRAANRGVAA